MSPKEFDDQKVEAFLESSVVSRDVYKAFLQGIEWPVVVIDRDYRLKTIIAGLEEISSIYLGKCCYKLAFNTDHPCTDCPVTHLFEKNESVTTQKHVCSPDEFKGGYEVQAYPLFDAQGNIAYAITGYRRMQNQQIDEADSETGINGRQADIHEILELESQPSSDGKTTQSLANLSKREIQVLRLMADGMTNSEIASLLSISPNTVKTYTVQIFNKLGVSNRTQASVKFTDL